MALKFSRKQIIIVGGGAFLAVIIVGLIFLNLRPKANSGTQAILNVWGVEDEQSFGSLVSPYPYAKVKYTGIDRAGYGEKLLAALAAGTGPDVFEIGNRELPKWQSALAPLPAAAAAQFGALQLANTFPDVVAQDFASGGELYGLPLSIDTLVMIYNKDLWNSAGIAVTPKTWDEFLADVSRLRAVNAQGQITQAAAAIGGSASSIPNAADILSLLFLQNGTQMTNNTFTSAQFASAGGTGLAAFNFYLQFANAASPYYTWNDAQGNAIDSFVAGKTAILFGYQSDLATIRAKAPFANIAVTAVPQPAGATISINYPKYRGFVAAKAGQSSALAWNFILYLTTTDALEKLYVSQTGSPPALRAEIGAAVNDPKLAVFALQALTAKSWYEADDAKVESILSDAIRNAESGAVDANRALNQAQTAVGALMSRR